MPEAPDRPLKARVAVFCGASRRIPEAYADEAAELGRLLAERGYGLVYGGGDVGLMGVLARAVHAHGGHVAGYIPAELRHREGVAYTVADELHVTETMHERKQAIFGRADAFAVLPGGLGTLEEFLEVVTLRQLGYHDKPIVLVNSRRYFDPLLDFLEESTEIGFAPEIRALFTVVDDPASAIVALEADL